MLFKFFKPRAGDKTALGKHTQDQPTDCKGESDYGSGSRGSTTAVVRADSDPNEQGLTFVAKHEPSLPTDVMPSQHDDLSCGRKQLTHIPHIVLPLLSGASGGFLARWANVQLDGPDWSIIPSIDEQRILAVGNIVSAAFVLFTTYGLHQWFKYCGLSAPTARRIGFQDLALPSTRSMNCARILRFLLRMGIPLVLGVSVGAFAKWINVKLDGPDWIMFTSSSGRNLLEVSDIVSDLLVLAFAYIVHALLDQCWPVSLDSKYRFFQEPAEEGEIDNLFNPSVEHYL